MGGGGGGGGESTKEAQNTLLQWIAHCAQTASTPFTNTCASQPLSNRAKIKTCRKILPRCNSRLGVARPLLNERAAKATRCIHSLLRAVQVPFFAESKKELQCYLYCCATGGQCFCFSRTHCVDDLSLLIATIRSSHVAMRFRLLSYNQANNNVVVDLSARLERGGNKGIST